jgi:hypothetical protein
LISDKSNNVIWVTAFGREERNGNFTAKLTGLQQVYIRYIHEKSDCLPLMVVQLEDTGIRLKNMENGVWENIIKEI